MLSRVPRPALVALPGALARARQLAILGGSLAHRGKREGAGMTSVVDVTANSLWDDKDAETDKVRRFSMCGARRRDVSVVRVTLTRGPHLRRVFSPVGSMTTCMQEVSPSEQPPGAQLLFKLGGLLSTKSGRCSPLAYSVYAVTVTSVVYCFLQGTSKDFGLLILLKNQHAGEAVARLGLSSMTASTIVAFHSLRSVTHKGGELEALGGDGSVPLSASTRASLARWAKGLQLLLVLMFFALMMGVYGPGWRGEGIQSSPSLNRLGALMGAISILNFQILFTWIFSLMLASALANAKIHDVASAEEGRPSTALHIYLLKSSSLIDRLRAAVQWCRTRSATSSTSPPGNTRYLNRPSSWLARRYRR